MTKAKFGTRFGTKVGTQVIPKKKRRSYQVEEGLPPKEDQENQKEDYGPTIKDIRDTLSQVLLILFFTMTILLLIRGEAFREISSMRKSTQLTLTIFFFLILIVSVLQTIFKQTSFGMLLFIIDVILVIFFFGLFVYANYN